jgi:hypothetical protein
MVGLAPDGLCNSGAPGGTRTPGLLVRSQSLYPAELRAHRVIAISCYHRAGLLDHFACVAQTVRVFQLDLRLVYILLQPLPPEMQSAAHAGTYISCHECFFHNSTDCNV